MSNNQLIHVGDRARCSADGVNSPKSKQNNHGVMRHASMSTQRNLHVMTIMLTFVDQFRI